MPQLVPIIAFLPARRKSRLAGYDLVSAKPYPAVTPNHPGAFLHASWPARCRYQGRTSSKMVPSEG